jgi:hypothetical protein
VKEYGRKMSWPTLRYYPGICLYKLRKLTEIPISSLNFEAGKFGAGSKSVTQSTATFGGG